MFKHFNWVGELVYFVGCVLQGICVFQMLNQDSFWVLWLWVMLILFIEKLFSNMRRSIYGDE